MVTLEQVKSGAVRFLERELVGGLTGWRKWVAGAGIALALENAEAAVSALMESPAARLLGVTDGEGNIDIDALHRVFRSEAEKGAAVFDVPMIGTVTMTAADIDKLHAYIKG